MSTRPSSAGTPGAARPLRIGVAAHADPESPSTWSGTPAGVIAGLRALGHDVVGLHATASPQVEKRVQQLLAVRYLPSTLRREPGLRAALAPARAAVRVSPAYARLGSLVMARSLRGAGELDLVVRMGTSFDLEHPRQVTFEDLTVAQALRTDWVDWRTASARARRGRLDHQRRVLEQAVACATATPWAARSVIEDYGIDPVKVAAVGLGINRITPPVDRDWSRPRFLFVGKDWEDKNGPVLVEAFARLHRELPTATLDLVGHHPAIEAPGVTGHGFLRLSDPEAGRRMTELFQRATCLVVPTTFEPAGIVHVEAAAAGVPSIGSALGGAADMIGPSGVTVEPGSVDSLVDAMRCLADGATARAMGEAGLERAGLFTWEKVAARILQAAGAMPRDHALWDGLFEVSAALASG